MINRDNPSLEYIKSKANEIPKFKKTIGIIEKELENKNTILAIGNAGALPDETYIIIRFSHKANEQYDELKDFGTKYKCITFCDNNGATIDLVSKTINIQIFLGNSFTTSSL